MLRKGDNPIDLICEQKLYDEGINYRISFHHLNFLNRLAMATVAVPFAPQNFHRLHVYEQSLIEGRLATITTRVREKMLMAP